MVGIVSYGTYIPRYRITLADIAGAWEKDPAEILPALGVAEKSVPGQDEDAVTMAIESALKSLATFQGKPSNIDTLFVGSESHPYAVNPTSTIVGGFLGIGNSYLAADFEFACKAATAAIQATVALISAGQTKWGLVIGTDTAQGKLHDALEYTAAAGAAAFLLGKTQVIAQLLSYTSFSSDTPDFWRRDGIRYPSHAGRFTGEPAYFAHVMGAALRLFQKAQCKPSDMDYCVFHMPNGKFPREAAKRLGFTPKQLAPSLVVDQIGNAYSATAMLGLSAVFDVAKPGQKIFMVSYGSGAGSDAFLWEATAAMRQVQSSVKQQIEKKTYIDYVQYLKQTHKI
jgi:hydroxymethylglutaryl-CoA synthase